MPRTRLQFIGTGMRFISWELAHPDVMQLVYHRLVANGMDRFIVLDPTHDADAMLTSARMIRRAGGAEVVAALTYTVSQVHDDDFYADGPPGSRLAGPTVLPRGSVGASGSDRARTLIPAVRSRLGDKPLELHSHTTIGLSQHTYPIAAGLGVPVLHVACGPLSDGSSLPDAQLTVANLRELGHAVDVDDRLLGLVADYLTRLARAEGLPAGVPQAYDRSFLRHQIAGGVMTTTRRQLAELGLEHRFGEVIEEVERVRAELGHPIMVTPFPQMVCSQALANVIGPERYATVPDQVIRYLLGTFGRPTGPVDPDVRDRIMSRPRARDLADEPPPASPAELRRRFRAGIGDEELLLRATMPGEQVDAMLAAGPARTRYNPDLAGVRSLLSALATRPPVSHLVVEKPDLFLELRRNDRFPDS
jgi:oxaloacetate decarboxylase alpha subunit